MQPQNQVLQSHEAEAHFVELGEDELDTVVGGGDWKDFWRVTGNVFSGIGDGAARLPKQKTGEGHKGYRIGHGIGQATVLLDNVL